MAAVRFWRLPSFSVVGDCGSVDPMVDQDFLRRPLDDGFGFFFSLSRLSSDCLACAAARDNRSTTDGLGSSLGFFRFNLDEDVASNLVSSRRARDGDDRIEPGEIQAAPCLTRTNDTRIITGIVGFTISSYLYRRNGRGT